MLKIYILLLEIIAHIALSFYVYYYTIRSNLK